MIDLNEDQTDSNCWTDGATVRLMVRQIDEWTNGQTGEQTDGRTDRQKVRWMDEQRD